MMSKPGKTVALFAAATVLAFGVKSVMAAGSVFVETGLVASSEPVSVEDMVSGWDGSFQAGEHAYANLNIAYGFSVDGWRFSRDQRWYYYLSFSKQTSRFFNSLEKGGGVEAGDVDLNAKSFQANGFSFSKSVEISEGWIVEPRISVYDINRYQFGSLKGFAESGSGESDLKASALLDYYFDEDKILEYEDDHKNGQGLSLSLSGQVILNPSFRLDYQLSDIWNRLEFDAATFTRGCIEFNSPANPICNAQGSASGRSGLDKYSTSISMTVLARLSYSPLSVEAAVYSHEKYRRLGLAKGWDTAIGQLYVQTYSTRQLGFRWQSGWHRLTLASDHSKASKTRDVDVNLSFYWRW